MEYLLQFNLQAPMEFTGDTSILPAYFDDRKETRSFREMLDGVHLIHETNGASRKV